MERSCSLINIWSKGTKMLYWSSSSKP